jgi:ABC-type oligopeptide transport system ATPase subunit
MVYREFKQALVNMERLFGLLDERRDVQDRPGAQVLAVTRPRVRFDGVRFGYDPRREILHGVDFEIAPGGTVAVVGHSGSGKSTLSRLLYRFYDVDAGAIRIDGRDLREFTQDSLRAAIAIVPQDTVLFNDTIYYNIRYGRPDASRAEVEGAARRGAHPRVHRDAARRLPDAGRRARAQALGRREAARRDRARAAEEPRDPDLRRGDVGARLEVGAGDPGRARADPGGPHRARDRAPALDRDERRRDPRDGRGPDRRARHARALLAARGRYAQMWQLQQEGRDEGCVAGAAGRGDEPAGPRADRAGMLAAALFGAGVPASKGCSRISRRSSSRACSISVPRSAWRPPRGRADSAAARGETGCASRRGRRGRRVRPAAAAVRPAARGRGVGLAVALVRGRGHRADRRALLPRPDRRARAAGVACALAGALLLGRARARADSPPARSCSRRARAGGSTTSSPR